MVVIIIIIECYINIIITDVITVITVIIMVVMWPVA